MESTNENRVNAEIAFSNRNLNEAIMWYQKALEEEPDDVYLLSRAGAVCVPLGKFDLALKYFARAKELDPTNGDNYFNYANACFFNKDYSTAFESYVEAEKKGCSDDIMPRLYYQLAMICSIRHGMDAQNKDNKNLMSALTYFKKCQDIDKEGVFSISPEFISEKMKIYMVLQDYENAERCAALLVASEPSSFRYYMVYYSILMAHKEYDKAEKILDDADKYSEASIEDKNSLLLQRAVIQVALGDKDASKKDEYLKKAESILSEKLKSGTLSSAQTIDFSLTLSEVLTKAENFDSAIRLLNNMIEGEKKEEPSRVKVNDNNMTVRLSDKEINEMLESDCELLQELELSGELDMESVEYVMDENWNYVPKLNPDAFSKAEKIQNERESAKKPKLIKEKIITDSDNKITRELREKIYFQLLTCYVAKEKFDVAEKYALYLNHSDNKYYGYYGKYVSTLAVRKLNKKKDVVDKAYAASIAYFRNRSFSDPSDNLAAIFRARLYAEEGKYEKATEISRLLGEDDRMAIEKYIEECKK